MLMEQSATIQKGMEESFRWGLFGWLWGLGMLGVVAILTAPLVLPAGTRLPMSETMVKLVGLIQLGVLLAILVGMGVKLGMGLGLRAPFSEALVTGQMKWVLLRPQIGPGLLGGLIAGVVIVVLARLAQPFLPAEFLEASANVKISLLARFLYGGITEELLLRWGVMTGLAWLVWRVGQGGVGTPANWVMGSAIVGAAVLFGVGHLPNVFTMVSSPTSFLVGYIVVLNMFGGLAYGWLFWRYGLEAAFMAHMMTHVVFLAAAAVGGG